MLKRVAFFVYGVVCYAVFLATFLYAVGFIGGFGASWGRPPAGRSAGVPPALRRWPEASGTAAWEAAPHFIGGFGVPKTLDDAASGSRASAIAIDLGLLALFAVQHSVMARRWFKERWTRIVSPVVERSTYVLLSSLALLLLFWQWRPLGGVVWSVSHPIVRAVLWSLFGFGWALLLVSTFLINHFDLFGLRQVWLALRGRPYTQLRFRTPGPYRLVRHPLYVGWLFAFWMTPVMTLAHLLFAVMTTAYILLAIRFEERDLVHAFGEAYEQYRQRVPMLIPGSK